MNKLVPILVLILMGLVVGYLLGGYVLAQTNYDQIWTRFLSHEWSEPCASENSSCESIHLDLSDRINFQIHNMPARYSLGSTLMGRWDLLIAEEDQVLFSLTGLSDEATPQAFVIYLMGTVRDQNQLELQWIDAQADPAGEPNELLDDTFIFERVR